MPSISNSYHTVAEQVISFNKNIVEILNNISTLTATTNPTVTLNVNDAQGNPTTVSLPSFSYLQSELNRLNNNINSLYGLNNNTATLQTSPNSWQKIVTVDLNLEPKDIQILRVPSSFGTKKNYLFDALLDPNLFIEIDLTGQINSNVKEILTRRYIVKFEINSSGTLTELGKNAVASFISNFKNKSNIVLEDFLIWQQTTPGVLNPAEPDYIEEIRNLEPNKLQFNGVFTVLKAETDANNVLWYYLDTLTYTEIETNQPRQLSTNDTLIINQDNSNTIYQIQQVSNSSSNPKVTLLRITGNQPIAPSIGALKFYSTVIQNNTIKIPVGYDEYNVVFIKALNTSNFLLSKNWSPGIGYYTNDLVLKSSDTYNGQTMQQYYTNEVSDYGLALKNLVTKIPVTKGVIPPAPVLDAANFQVVQTNAHLTDVPDIQVIKQQSAQIDTLNTQATQISAAILAKNKAIQVTRFTNESDKQQYLNDVNSLQVQYNSVTNLKASINTEILNSSAIKVQNIQPAYAVRGFWAIPGASLTASTIPQEIVKFEVQYKKLSKDGIEAPIHTFRLHDITVSTESKATAAYSNWTPLTTLSRKRKYNPETGGFTWEVNDQSDPDVININQLNIDILPNELVEIRMRSISEVGFPENPIESDWSNTISIEFPNNLNQMPNVISTIVNNAQMEQVKTNLITTLNNQGLNDLLNQKVVINNTSYYLTSEKILSGYKDDNGNAIDLFQYLQDLTKTISTLQALVDNAQGKLVVTVFNDSTPYQVEKNSVLNFTVNCEDHLQNISGNTVIANQYIDNRVAANNTPQSFPTGRVYANNIYVVKNYYLRISNGSTSNSLGLLSNTTYTSGANTDVFNSAVPQVFWVDDQHNLITSDVTGQSKTQLDYQFLWSVNYESVNSTTVTKLADNISNLFTSNNNNSLTDILSSTEYNLGYSDASVLSFVGNNNSLLDANKWIDVNSSISSSNKLLTSVHPQVQQLTDIQETNVSKVHNLASNGSIDIPLNIYFKMNAFDPTKSNNSYLTLNGVTQNIRHIKKLKFTLYNKADNTPFTFTVVFTINRVNVIQQKILASSPNSLGK